MGGPCGPEFSHLTLNTFFNGGEPSDNFIGIVTNTDAAGVAGYESFYNLDGTGIVLKDGNIHSARLNYDGGNLSMSIDGISIFSNVPLDLSNGTDLSGNSFVGFGARNGLATENHDILSWSFSNVPEPSSAAILTVGDYVRSSTLPSTKSHPLSSLLIAFSPTKPLDLKAFSGFFSQLQSFGLSAHWLSLVPPRL